MKKQKICLFTICLILCLNGCGALQQMITDEVPTVTDAVIQDMIAPTNTVTPIETQKDEPTAIPEPTTTIEPTATPGPTVTIAPTATPEPTATPVPTNTPTPMPEPTESLSEIALPEDLMKLNLGQSDVSCVLANSGVIITVKNDRYGAFDYRGNELVAHEYPIVWTGPNAEGYFCLGNKEKASVFDSDGNMVHEIVMEEWTNIATVQISEEVVTYRMVFTEGEGSRVAAYDIANEKEIEYEIVSDQEAVTYGDMHRYITSAENDSFYATYGAGVFKVSREGEVQPLYENEFVTGLPGGQVYFVNSPRDGYGVMFTDNDILGRRIGLIEVENQEMVLLDAKELISMSESEQKKTIALHNYYVDGQYYSNIGKKIVVSIGDAKRNTLECMLLDLSKATVEMVEVRAPWNEEYVYGIEPMVSNTEEIIIAKYKEITICESGKCLASDGNNWFYLDQEGNILKSYQDASEFRNGYAVVLDKDGFAYVIDAEFNKVSGKYMADSVLAIGDGFLLRGAEEDIVFVFNE